MLSLASKGIHHRDVKPENLFRLGRPEAMTFPGILEVEPAGIEPATSCLQKARDADRLWAGSRFLPCDGKVVKAVDRIATRSWRLALPSRFHAVDPAGGVTPPQLKQLERHVEHVEHLTGLLV